MDISFIIPVYNTKIDLLDRCIASLLPISKIYEIEIIVIDDGSEEYVSAFLRESHFENLIYRRKKNGGVSSARNEGLRIAKGKYISFVDADDTVEPNAYTDIKELPEIDLLIMDMDIISEKKTKIWHSLDRKSGLVEKQAIMHSIIDSNRMNSPCSKLFKHDIVKKNDILFDETMVTGEDLMFVMDYLSHASRCYYLNVVAYHYYRDEQSRVNRIKKYPDVYFENIERIGDRLLFAIKEYSFDPSYKEKLMSTRVSGLFNYYSDLILTKRFSRERADKVYKAIEKIDNSRFDFKTKIKHYCLINKRYNAMIVLSCLRSVYLRLKA